MRVRFTPAPGAVIRIKTFDGRELTNEELEFIEVQPFFTSSTGSGGVFNGVSMTAKNAEIDRFTIIAGGRNGRVIRSDLAQDKSVIPLVDRKAKVTQALPGQDGQSVAPEESDAYAEEART